MEKYVNVFYLVMIVSAINFVHALLSLIGCSDIDLLHMDLLFILYIGICYHLESAMDELILFRKGKGK